MSVARSRRAAVSSGRLLTPADLERSGCEAVPEADRSVCREVLRWAQTYLCQPHERLGRRGAVCPFVAGSLARQSFYLDPVETPTPDDEVIEAIARQRGALLSARDPLAAADVPYETILILFPALADDRLAMLDAAQRRLKPEFVARGRMIGQFHARPPDNPGLWNPDFRPLASPVPMLVVRHMVATDLPFLLEREDFVVAWFRRFGRQATVAQREMLRRAVDTDAYTGFETVWGNDR